MSFSADIKNSLCAISVKPRCCRRALVYGMLYAQSDFENRQFRFSTDNENCAKLMSHMVRSVFGETLAYEVYDKLSRNGQPVKAYRALIGDDFSDKMSREFQSNAPAIECQGCASCFVRGVFLASGTVSDPESGYHLEFSVSDSEKGNIITELLLEESFEVKRTVRRGVSSLYVKKSEVIEDILTFIGASSYSIRIMDIKIVREIRNNENRKNNCDTANIYKSTGAAQNMIKRINRLVDDGRIDGLDQQLRVTADLRRKNPELSLSELAGIHEPPITKSGLSHRLAKISAYYDKFYTNENEEQ